MFNTPDALRDFFRYVKWADRLQWEAAAALNDAAYFRDHGWSFGTIHKVMLHQLSAQEVWRRRFAGEQLLWLGDAPDLQHDRAALVTTWQDVHDRFDAFLAPLTPERLGSTLHYQNLKGEKFAAPLARLLTHAMNHSTVHRGQLNSMLKLSGATPPGVDYSTWCVKTGLIVTET